MSSAQVVNVTLPALSGWSADKDFNAVGKLSASTQRNLEPVGPHFLAHARRKRHQRTFSEDERIQAQQNSQDHYAVLGLSKYRWRATPEQIKRAHRKKVLRHHPDKKAALGDRDENDNFFKCIQKATELLTDPVKRRQFDSVDEAAEVEPPTKKEASKGNFFKLWRPVFVAESRFSKIQPVPQLGDENSTFEEVDSFYNFWYTFDSWRTFEYLDEDVPDDNENRDQKRHVEKKNANARRKRKTEDTARLRHLVDDCAAQDERIKNFRKAARAGKDKKRLEKEAEAKRLADEKEKARQEEEQRKKDAEEAAKLSKNKRVLKGSVKDVNYFAESGEPSAAQVDSVLTDVDFVISKIDSEELAALAERLTGAGKDAAAVKGVYVEEVKRLVGAGKAKEGEAKFFA
ncbi:hypothetical protein ARAM_002177 [Aspergillus rambellii]|uniref:J domain-containing protein n=1 Tax=Aspergillus rambellii TaxID=308745 RepID=A0A0F8V3R4_9EURO|nr:hypothetical protein ARAM_002177 [Aspergillus rambellii]